MTTSWYRCRVLRAGSATDEDRVYVLVASTEGRFPGERWIFSDSAARREILSVALTAMTAAMPVDLDMELGSDLDDYRPINRMYMVRG